MPTFSPIRSVDDLPPPGPRTGSAENYRIDFKNGYDPADRQEMAKDIAAFANGLGGVVLIGSTRDDQALGYPGLRRALAEQLSNAFDEAHRDLLSPQPFLERVIVDLPDTDRVLLAVNVAPFPGQVVGARLQPNVWRFPVRVGAQTDFMTPALLPLLSAEVRRKMVLLDKIPRTEDVELSCCVPTVAPYTAHPRHNVRVVDVDPWRNTLTVLMMARTQCQPRIPLDDVDAVWHTGRFWSVRTTGHLVGENFDYNPHFDKRYTRM